MKRILLAATAALSILATASTAQDRPSYPGPAVDAQGRVIDPSENVKALNEAAQKRQDDLRALLKELIDSKFDAMREMVRMTSDKLESDAKLRAESAAAVNATEKDRVNAIRSVDVGAVAVASERATATASALAKTVQDSAAVLSAQVTKSADDVRILVKTTADEQNRNLSTQFTAIQGQFTSVGTRLTALEQAGAEGVGKQKFQDPAIAALLAKVETIVSAQAANAGTNAGRGDVVGWAAAGVAILIAFGSLMVAVFRSKPHPA